MPRFAVGLLLTPAALSIGAISIANAAGLDDRESFTRPGARGLPQDRELRAARAPAPGLVAADIDFGPFLLALTPHSVLAAPYHRLSSGILAGHAVFAAPPDDARRAISRLGVAYVVTCGPRPPNDLAGPALGASLWGRLQAKDVPAWLEPLSPPGQPFNVYRVRS